MAIDDISRAVDSRSTTFIFGDVEDLSFFEESEDFQYEFQY
jgi:hypothetical protein